MRYGLAWMSADGVVEVFRLEEFVDAIRNRRSAGERWPGNFGRLPAAAAG